MNRRTLTVMALLALAFALIACQPAAATPVPPPQAPAESTKPAPKPEKLTVLCGAQEDWCQAMTKAFEAETGVKTSFVRMSSGEALARIRATKDSPEFSIWHGGPADGYIAATNEGLLVAYDSPSAAKIPASYKDANGHWNGVYVGALGFCSNKDVLARLGVATPTSWADLLNPKLKGQVSMAHPASSGTAYTALWTQITLNGGDVDKGFAYFRNLHNNILQYTKSGSAPGQMAGRGEVATAVIFSHDCVKFNEEGMNSLVVSFPSEGTGYEIGGVAIIKGGPEQEAAKMY
ncbi:MAG TPA: ABC transporter substrate-binding protein, partial [Anaerolineae bacterium]|nr:ABC transporter substrate-binding protein [Anaerolineae bacterium]